MVSVDQMEGCPEGTTAFTASLNMTLSLVINILGYIHTMNPHATDAMTWKTGFNFISFVGTSLHSNRFQRGLDLGIMSSSRSTQVTSGEKNSLTHSLLILEITLSTIGSNVKGGKFATPYTVFLVDGGLSARNIAFFTNS